MDSIADKQTASFPLSPDEWTDELIVEEIDRQLEEYPDEVLDTSTAAENVADMIQRPWKDVMSLYWRAKGVRDYSSKQSGDVTHPTIDDLALQIGEMFGVDPALLIDNLEIRLEAPTAKDSRARESSLS